jgi:hypothetical protein
MQLPATYDITAYRNGRYREGFTLKIDNVAVDMTGGDLQMQLRDAVGDTGTPVLDLTPTPTANGSYIQFTSASTGQFEVYIAFDDMDALPEVGTPVSAVDTWQYDIVYTEVGGDKYPIIKGAFVMNEGVTR